MTEAQAYRVVVAGCGISGLTAAFRVLELSKRNNLSIDLTLLEASDRVGGMIQTIQKEGLLLETGPDCFSADKEEGLSLCQRLELAHQIQRTNDAHRRMLVARGDRLLPVPPGFRDFRGPASMKSIWRSRLFSTMGKLRIGMEQRTKRKPRGEDESVRSFVTRRFGTQMLDRLVQPLVGETFASDPDKLSVRTALPKWWDMESSRHGSVLKAMKESDAESQRLISFKNGMSTLTEALAEKIGVERIRFRAPAARLERAADGSGQWSVVLLNNDVVPADAVILACPVHQTATIVDSIDPALAKQLSEIACASLAVVHFVMRRDQIEHPLNAFGFVVPAADQRYILSCTFSSAKFEGRAPDDWVVLRTTLGGALQEELLQRDDDGLIAAARWDLEILLGLLGPPRFMAVHRWLKAVPQYHVGHASRIAAIEEQVEEHPLLQLAGNAYEGLGVSDAIASGEHAAEKIMAALWHKRKQSS